MNIQFASIAETVSATLASEGTDRVQIAELNDALRGAAWVSTGDLELPTRGRKLTSGLALADEYPHERAARGRVRDFLRNVAVGLALLATGVGAVQARAETVSAGDVVVMPLDTITATILPTVELRRDDAPVLVPDTALVWECGPWVELHQGSGKARTCQWTRSTADAVWGETL